MNRKKREEYGRGRGAEGGRRGGGGRTDYFRMHMLYVDEPTSIERKFSKGW